MTEIPLVPLAGILLTAAIHGTLPAVLRGSAPWAAPQVWLVFTLLALVAVPGAALALLAGAAVWPAEGICAADAVPVLAGGLLWGCSAIAYAMAVERLGAALGAGLFMGASMVAGVAMPILLVGPWPDPGAAAVLAVGIACGVAGIALGARAGRTGAAAAAPATTGVVLALGGGTVTNAVTLGLLLPTGVNRLVPGDPQVAGLVLVLAATLLTAAPVTGLWAVAAIRRRDGWRDLSAIRPGPALRAAGLCLLWPVGLAATFLALPRLGALGPSVGTGLMLVAQLLVVAWWGARLGEWRGRPAAARLHRRSVAALVAAALAIAVAAHLHPTGPAP
ncbi:MAG: hypothetical protein RLZZ127_96 [Planctomycetota bacterium]|jgi:hypothetical protein